MVARQNSWKAVLGGVLLGLGAITFFLAQSTLWVSSTIFNEKVFVDTVQSVLATDEGRDAIAGAVVDATLKDNPVAEQLIGKQVTSLVGGLLKTDLASTIFDSFAHRTYAYLTAPDRQDITIELEAIKSPLSGLIRIVEQTGRPVNFTASSIPDSVIILKSDAVPNVSGYIRSIVIVNALLWLAAIVAFVSYLFLNRTRIVTALYIAGAVIITVSLVGLLTGPFVPPAIAGLVNSISIRGLVEQLSAALLAPFQVQLLSGIVLTSAVLLAVNLRGAIKAGVTRLIGLVR